MANLTIELQLFIEIVEMDPDSLMAVLLNGRIRHRGPSDGLHPDHTTFSFATYVLVLVAAFT